ncbi:hypothetical protein [Pseudonocardia humida]|uniref:Uncharacterized protein n=1 Tax=Pseudonocardia humida TaxID=2800819 RepID=A0ABT0ZY69_9PSEU|nr:hypothetical protein [Pseudonocardia humida]MCO1655604.1 hypothetical protein [Pseudonocardia humida]
MTVRRPFPQPAVHHIDRDVAVADTSTGVLLTTTWPKALLTPEQARSLGWALIEAAEFVDARIPD